MSKFLRESQSGIERVDTEAGIIYGVKVLGPRSRNGRVYEDSAIRKALPLYEGVTVNINHVRNDPTTRAYQERQMQDRWGVLRNVRYKEGSIYADLHYIKSHPMTKQLVEAAQRFPEIFGLSHDAGGDEQLIDGERRVVEMYEVKSVDVVADPATNEGLFESYRPVDPARARAARKKARLSLYETRDGDGDGKINDGKSSEGPAPPKQPKAAKARATKSSPKPAQKPRNQAGSTTQSEAHFAKNKKTLGPIVEKTLGFDTTETRNSDRLDFAETSVWSMRKAGQEAFRAGAGRDPKPSEQGAIDKVLKSQFSRGSLETTNSSDDFSEIHVASARQALSDIHQQGILSNAGGGSSKTSNASSKLSQADRIARAERRAKRYERMAGKSYSRGKDYIDASKQIAGPMSDRLKARGDEFMSRKTKLMSKSGRVKQAIAKVSEPVAPE